MGELWAWPSALKLALLDHLRARADVLAGTRAHRLAADRLAAAVEAGARRTDLWPEQVHHAFVTRLLQRSRALGPSAPTLHHQLDLALARARTDHRGRDRRGRPAPGDRAGGHGEPDRQPPPDFDVRLE